MNVDFRLYRRIARGACSAALIGSLVGGCASTHKPRFWDKEDGTTVADANATPTECKSDRDSRHSRSCCRRAHGRRRRSHDACRPGFRSRFGLRFPGCVPQQSKHPSGLSV